jgi:hypothetical protein
MSDEIDQRFGAAQSQTDLQQRSNNSNQNSVQDASRVDPSANPESEQKTGNQRCWWHGIAFRWSGQPTGGKRILRALAEFFSKD